MLHKEMLGLGLLFFVLWVFLGSTPSARLERGCAPVAWSGNVVTSLAALATPNYQASAEKWTGTMTYSCEFTGWRLFYSADYNRWLADQQAQADQAKSNQKGAAVIPVGPVPVKP